MFRLVFATDNDAVQTPDEIADLVQEVANKIRAGHGNGNVRDANGNTVGSFDVASES